MENVTTEITKLGPCKTKIKLNVSSELVNKLTDETYTELQKKVQIPGFRKGFVPLEIIKNNYSDIAKKEVIEKILLETLYPTLKEKNIPYIGTPEILSINFSFGKNCTYEVILETEPEFKLKNYKGLKLTKEIYKVTQNNIDEFIQGLRKQNFQLTPSKKDKILPEDVSPESKIFCVINYKVFSNGKELKNFHKENMLVDLSSNTVLPELKKCLVGMSRGDEKNFKVTLPENLFSSPELKGKEVEFHILLREIKEKTLPEINDEFAKDLGYKNLDELISFVKQKLQQEFDFETYNELKNQIYDILLKEHNFSLPENELKIYEDEYINLLEQEFISRGGKKEEFKLSKEEQEKIHQKITKELKLKYILKKIIETENIKITDEEFEKEKGKYLVLNPGKENEINKYFENNKDRIISNILEQRVVEIILSSAKIKEIDITSK